MNAKQTSVSDLVNALGEDWGTVERQYGPPVWKLKERRLGSARTAFHGFASKYSDCFDLLVVNGQVVEGDITQHFSENDTVSFEVSFPVADNIFVDFDHAAEYYISSKQKFDKLFIFNPPTLVSTKQSTPPIWKEFLEEYCRAVNALECLRVLAHHNGTTEAIYVDSKESSTPSVAICTEFPLLYERCKGILSLKRDYGFLCKLASDIAQKKPNYLKELSIFRSSIVELLKKEEGDAETHGVLILQNIEKLEKIYSNNLQAYISGLSLEKIRTELAAEQLKFSDQASRSLTDISGKMFALPAAIGIARLAGNGLTPFNRFFVILTCVILLLPLVAQLKQLRVIRKSSEIAFADLDEKIEQVSDTKVRTSFTNVRRGLKGSIRTVWWMLWFYVALSIGVMIISSGLVRWNPLFEDAASPVSLISSEQGPDAPIPDFERSERDRVLDSIQDP